jgi:hypothetical protein
MIYWLSLCCNHCGLPLRLKLGITYMGELACGVCSDAITFRLISYSNEMVFM